MMGDTVPCGSLHRTHKDDKSMDGPALSRHMSISWERHMCTVPGCYQRIVNVRAHIRKQHKDLPFDERIGYMKAARPDPRTRRNMCTVPGCSRKIVNVRVHIRKHHKDLPFDESIAYIKGARPDRTRRRGQNEKMSTEMDERLTQVDRNDMLSAGDKEPQKIKSEGDVDITEKFPRKESVQVLTMDLYLSDEEEYQDEELHAGEDVETVHEGDVEETIHVALEDYKQDIGCHRLTSCHDEGDVARASNRREDIPSSLKDVVSSLSDDQDSQDDESKFSHDEADSAGASSRRDDIILFVNDVVSSLTDRCLEKFDLDALMKIMLGGHCHDGAIFSLLRRHTPEKWKVVASILSVCKSETVILTEEVMTADSTLFFEKAVHTVEKCLRKLARLTGQNVEKSLAVTSFPRKHAELQASDVVNEHLKWHEKRHPRRLPGIDMRPLRLYFGHLTDIYATLLMTLNCHRVTVLLFLSIVLSVAVVCA